MTTSFNSLSLLLLVLVFALFSCDDDSAPVNTPPTINITSPTDAQLAAGFSKGSDVVITGTVEDNNLVSTLTTKIFYNGIDTGMGETVTIGEKSASINETVNTSGAPAGNYRFVLTATDDEGLTAVWDKTVRIQ